jgi:hypothetical protein
MGMSNREGWPAAAPRQFHGRRQQDSGNGHGVDERRQQTRSHHQGHHEQGFAALGEALQRLSKAMGDAGARETRGQDEHGPHGDHRGTAEAGQSLLRGDQAGQRKGREHQQTHHIYTQPANDEKDKRGKDNRKQCNDLKRQNTSLFSL